MGVELVNIYTYISISIYTYTYTCERVCVCVCANTQGNQRCQVLLELFVTFLTCILRIELRSSEKATSALNY